MRFLLLSLILLLSACATTTTQKVYRNMAIAGAIGAIYGYSQPSYKQTQAALNGSAAAAIAAAATLYFENPDKEEIKLRNEVERLKTKLDEISSPKPVTETAAMFGAKVPSKYKELIKPGEWKVYRMDQWVEDGENRLVHQDKAVELIPPSLVVE